MKPETCTCTRCPMLSAALRGMCSLALAVPPGTVRGGSRRRCAARVGGWGTTGAMPTWSATARRRSPHLVCLPCSFAPHAGHFARILSLHAHQVNHGVAGVLCAPSILHPSFQVAIVFAFHPAIVHLFSFQGNRASLWAKYHLPHSHSLCKPLNASPALSPPAVRIGATST